MKFCLVKDYSISQGFIIPTIGSGYFGIFVKPLGLSGFLAYCISLRRSFLVVFLTTLPS